MVMELQIAEKLQFNQQSCAACLFGAKQADKLHGKRIQEVVVSKNPQEALGQLLANTQTLQLATLLAPLLDALEQCCGNVVKLLHGLGELQHIGAGQA